jgi:hypothetical protein
MLLTPSELKSTATLQAKMSFEAKRQPLAELLAELQKQSGVKLTLAADAPQVRVTAYVQELSQAEDMNALTRLYGTKWSRDAENTYTLHGSGLSELEQTLIKVGDVNAAEYRFWGRQRQEAEQVSLKLRNGGANEPLLARQKGMSFSDLSKDTQQALRQHMETRMAFNIVRAFQSASEPFLEWCTLRAASPKLVPQQPGDTSPPRYSQDTKMDIMPPSAAPNLATLPFPQPPPNPPIDVSGQVVRR